MRLITFDVEDYHHLLDIPGLSDQYDDRKSIVEKETTKILALLDLYDTRALFFVLGEVAERFPHLVKSIADKGHVLGSHSHSHLLHKEMTDAEFTEDLKRSRDAIKEASGQEVECYRAPGFSIQAEFYHRFEIMRKEGIRYDFSLFQGPASHGGVDIKEVDNIGFDTKFGEVKSFPFSRSHVYGLNLPLFGGGYFRLAPLSIIKSALSTNKYIVTYFHPRDFSREQPRLKGLNLMRYFRAYYGISSAAKKLEFILQSNNWDGIDLFTGGD
jgi:peptidoglycan-N-acetylglucosamine deacetylase